MLVRSMMPMLLAQVERMRIALMGMTMLLTLMLMLLQQLLAALCASAEVAARRSGAPRAPPESGPRAQPAPAHPPRAQPAHLPGGPHVLRRRGGQAAHQEGGWACSAHLMPHPQGVHVHPLHLQRGLRVQCLRCAPRAARSVARGTGQWLVLML